MKEIYQLTAAEVQERVNSHPDGLSKTEVEQSRERSGWNDLTDG